MKSFTLAFYLILLKKFPLQTKCEEMNAEEDHDLLNAYARPTRSTVGFLSSLADTNKTVTYVFHSVEVVDISRVSLETMDFRVDLHLKQRWRQVESEFPLKDMFPPNTTDEDYITVNAATDDRVLGKLWTPDVYIPNARITQIAAMKDIHSSLLVFRNRTMIFSARLFVILGCQMQFQWYPMDVQHCELILESYSYNIKQVEFLWTNISQPVLSSPDIKLLRYAVRFPLSYTSDKDIRFGRGESFSRVIVNFIFERQIGHQLIQVFTPTFLIVALSWFSFWLGLDAVPGRVSLVVTCMLTLVTMYSGLKSDLPPVAYIKMLDIWMAGCMGFVFAAMCEFVIVKYMCWTNERQKKKEEEIKRLNGSLFANKRQELDKSSYPLSINMFPSDKRRPSIMHLTHSEDWRKEQAREIDADEYTNAKKWAFNAMMKENEALPFSLWNKPVKKRKFIWERIDRISRVAFPFAFLIFLCIFWPVLILGSNTQK